VVEFGFSELGGTSIRKMSIRRIMKERLKNQKSTLHSGLLPVRVERVEEKCSH
jgi:hypothetical protein